MKKLQNNQAGIVHHIGLFLIVVVVLGAVGFAGMRVLQARQSAKAATWDQIAYNDMNPGDLRVYACKVDDNLAKVYVKNTSSYTLNVTTGLSTVEVKPNSNSGPFSSKWIGSVSWNNISDVKYDLAGTVAASSVCE